MTDTANQLVPEQGKFRRALAAVGAFLQSMDSPSFDYTLDRIERLEREVGRLKEEMRQSRDPGAVDAQNAMPLRSNIDSAAGASLEARIDRAPLSRSDVARPDGRLYRHPLHLLRLSDVDKRPDRNPLKSAVPSRPAPCPLKGRQPSLRYDWDWRYPAVGAQRR